MLLEPWGPVQVGNAAVLPTGWEMAYNHYVGRLGLPMPESRQLLLVYAPDCYLFQCVRSG